MAVTRNLVVAWSRWCVTNKHFFVYREKRPMNLDIHTRPLVNDCSETTTLVFHQAGAPDPNGLAYDGRGNTETLAAHGTEIPPTAVEPGDLVIYYGDEDRLPGFTEHVAIVVALTPGGPDNPLTMSHGYAAEPALVNVRQDGRPHRYFRYLPTLAEEEATEAAAEMLAVEEKSGSNVSDAQETQASYEKASEEAAKEIEVTKPSGNEKDPAANQAPKYASQTTQTNASITFPTPAPVEEPTPPDTEPEATPTGTGFLEKLEGMVEKVINS
jgi:hypothetical protein